MKKIVLFALCLAIVATLCSCSQSQGNSHGTPINTTSTGDGSSTQDANSTQTPIQSTSTESPKADETSAATALKMVAHASTAEEALPYLVDATEERAQQLAEYYPNNVEVDMHYVTAFRDYEVFKNTVSDPDTGASETGYCLMQRGEDGYRVCGSTDLLNDMVAQFRCKTCNGQGSTTIGDRIACGICSGTGQQYIPNQYFDAALNMWMGGYVGCGGCGGSGFTGNAVTNTCPTCLGECLVF